MTTNVTTATGEVKPDEGACATFLKRSDPRWEGVIRRARQAGLAKPATALYLALRNGVRGPTARDLIETYVRHRKLFNGAGALYRRLTQFEDDVPLDECWGRTLPRIDFQHEECIAREYWFNWLVETCKLRGELLVERMDAYDAVRKTVGPRAVVGFARDPDGMPFVAVARMP